MKVATYKRIKVKKDNRGEGVVGGDRPFASCFSPIGVELVSTLFNYDQSRTDLTQSLSSKESVRVESVEVEW